jgi:hypothetical protein
MRLIGCDLHASQQSIAMLDGDTGEIVEKTLTHEGGVVREFYASIPPPAELWALHAKTNIRDLERLIMFLNKFHKALWEMYYNGKRPRLRPMRWSVRSLVAEKVEKLRGGLVQEDIVAEAKICLGLLTKAATISRVALGVRSAGDDWGSTDVDLAIRETVFQTRR